MSRLQKSILFILGITAVALWYAVFEESREGLSVYFLDVGQGDSIFIQGERGSQIMIDGGQGDAVLTRLGNVMPFYDRTIDMLILTHPDADHLGGLVEVLGRYRVRQILTTGVFHDTAQYAEWRERIEKNGIPVMHAAAGQAFRADGAITFEVISPLYSLEGTDADDLNNTSMVLRMAYADVSLLFAGDIEEKTERLLAVVASAVLDADILKVAHHGSKTSSSDEFLLAVTPAAAVISVGRQNRFGHPHPDVLTRYADSGVPVYRTDTDGTVELRVLPDGRYWFR